MAGREGRLRSNVTGLSASSRDTAGAAGALEPTRERSLRVRRRRISTPSPVQPRRVLSTLPDCRRSGHVVSTAALESDETEGGAGRKPPSGDDTTGRAWNGKSPVILGSSMTIVQDQSSSERRACLMGESGRGLPRWAVMVAFDAEVYLRRLGERLLDDPDQQQPGHWSALRHGAAALVYVGAAGADRAWRVIDDYATATHIRSGKPGFAHFGVPLRRREAEGLPPRQFRVIDQEISVVEVQVLVRDLAITAGVGRRPRGASAATARMGLCSAPGSILRPTPCSRVWLGARDAPDPLLWRVLDAVASRSRRQRSH